jgi:hypothetical protein
VPPTAPEVRGAGSPLTGRMLIVTREGSVSNSWRPSEGCAALVLDRDEIELLLNHVNDTPLFRIMGIEWLVFDWSGWSGQKELLSETEHVFVRMIIATSQIPRSGWAIIPPRHGSVPGFNTLPPPGSIDELLQIISRESLRAPA